MITLFHGDNTVASRSAYTRELERLEQRSVTVRRVDAKNLQQLELESLLGTQELFSSQTALAIEGLFSLPKSARQQQMISMLKSASVDVVLWDKKTVTATQQKQLGKPAVRVFQTSPVVFSWLESVVLKNAVGSIKLANRAMDQEGADVCFSMLIRQIRLLLQTKAGVELQVAPFVAAKLKKQASMFTLNQLLNMHRELLGIDERLKTSSTMRTLHEEIEWLLLSFLR
ncbi:MAG TPA: hypothetical protein VJ246_03970 [Patescibacteria group bacterium]|nr:hypothetical protein [Patescibacteria group bacterium]